MDYRYHKPNCKEELSNEDFFADKETLRRIDRLHVVIETPTRMLGIYRMQSGEFFDAGDQSVCTVDLADNEDFHSEKELIQRLSEFYGLPVSKISIDIDPNHR